MRLCPSRLEAFCENLAGWSFWLAASVGVASAASHWFAGVSLAGVCAVAAWCRVHDTGRDTRSGGAGNGGGAGLGCGVPGVAGGAADAVGVGVASDWLAAWVGGAALVAYMVVVIWYSA